MPSGLPLIVQPSSGVPIYRQLIDQIRAMVAGGKLAAGSSLPSVRALAQELDINMMTVSKAYSRLEAEGYLVRDRGVGMRVAGEAAGSAAARLEELAPLSHELVARGRQLSLTDQQILGSVRSELKSQTKPS